MTETHEDGPAVWRPTPEGIERARITAYTRWLERERGLSFPDYEALWRWSTQDMGAFWASIWDHFEVRASAPYERVLADARMPGARWFPGARLNYVDQVFRFATESRPAIIHRNEAGEGGEVSFAELERRAGALAATLRGLGVGRGDRVVAYLPNIPETIVAFLAVASLGAVWSVCSPDMGRAAVLDRFRQIEPKVLIAGDGSRFGGKVNDRRGLVAELAAELPTLNRVILVPVVDAGPVPGVDALPWAEATAGDTPLRPEPVPFDHPLWIVYSSGTTGLPKAIVHGHGGVMLEAVKLMALHNDLGPEDRFHWYTSTGWIMWNCQVGGLLVGSTICLYDGSPFHPDAGALWRFAAETGVTFLGAGAAYFTNCAKAGIVPAEIANLSRLRAVGSTGSPLPPESYRFVREKVGAHLWLTPISGGTDFAGAFVAGLPTLPVHEGEMQVRCLGARVEAYDDEGRPVIDRVGELVCTAPMPSMPLTLWNDPDGRRYRESYFETYPGVWRHGDWIRITPRGGAIIYGRSDTTINRQGVRMGTSEIYRVVEAEPEILDSLVVDLEYLGRPSFMPLFVVMREGAVLDEALRDRLRVAIRRALSPRHVPDAILPIREVPRTLSGKKMELPVKRLLLGHDPTKVASPDSMANPASLAWFVDYASRLNGDRASPPAPVA